MPRVLSSCACGSHLIEIVRESGALRAHYYNRSGHDVTRPPSRVRRAAAALAGRLNLERQFQLWIGEN